MQPSSSGPSSATTRTSFANTSMAVPIDGSSNNNHNNHNNHSNNSNNSDNNNHSHNGRLTQYPLSENISATVDRVRSGGTRSDDSRPRPGSYNLGSNHGVQAFPPARRPSDIAWNIQGLDCPPDQQQYRQPIPHETQHAPYYQRNNHYYGGSMRFGQQDYAHHGTRSPGFSQSYGPINNPIEHSISRNDREGYDERSRPSMVPLSSSRPHSEVSNIPPPRRSSYGDPAVSKSGGLYMDISKRKPSGPLINNTERYPGRDPPSKVHSAQYDQSLPRWYHRSRSQEPPRTPGTPGHYRQDHHHREYHSGHPDSRPPLVQQAHAYSVQGVPSTSSMNDRQHENQQLPSEQATKLGYRTDPYSRPIHHQHGQLSSMPPDTRQSSQRTRAPVNYDDLGHLREGQVDSQQHQYPTRYTPEQHTGAAPREASTLSSSGRNYAGVDAQHRHYEYGEQAREHRQKQQYQHTFQETFVTQDKTPHGGHSYRSMELGKQQLNHSSFNNTLMDPGHERSSLQQQPRPPPSLQEDQGRLFLPQGRIQQTTHTQAVQQFHEHRSQEAPAWDMSSVGKDSTARSHTGGNSTGAASQPTTSSMRMSEISLFISDPGESGSGRANDSHLAPSISRIRTETPVTTQGIRRDRVGSGALTALGDSGDSKGGVCSQQLQYRGAKCGAGDGEKLDEDKLEHNGRGDYVYMRSEGEDCGFKKEKGSSSASSSTAGSDRWPESDPAPKTGSSNKRQAPPEEISSMDVHKDSRKRRTSSLSSVTLCPEALSPGDNQAISEVPPNVHRASSRLGSLRRRPSRAFMATAPLNNADRAAQALRAIYEQGRDISRIGVGTSERRDRHVRSLQDSSETPSHETGATLPTTSLTMERIPSPATGVAMLLYPFDSDSAVPTERFPAVAANSRGTHSSGGYDCPPVAPLEPIDHHYASQISTATESQRADSVASSRRSDNEQLTSLASSVVATRDGPVSSAVLSASLKSASHGTGDGRTTLLAEVLTPTDSLEKSYIAPTPRPVSPCAVSKMDKVLPIADPMESCGSGGCGSGGCEPGGCGSGGCEPGGCGSGGCEPGGCGSGGCEPGGCGPGGCGSRGCEPGGCGSGGCGPGGCGSSDCGPSGRAARLGEEGYYTTEDIEALYAMWKAHDSAAETPPKSGIEREDEGARRRTRKGKGRRRTSQSSIEEHHVFEDDEEVDDDNCSEIDEIIDDSEDEDDDDDDDDDCKEENPSKRQRVTEKVRSKLNGRGKGRKKERRSGEEVKRHQCQTCGKRFSRPSQLETHMLTHTGEKPHFCTTCGKQFNVASNLKRHIRTHQAGKRNGIGFGNIYEPNAFLLRVPRESAMGLGLDVNGFNGALPQPLRTIHAVVQLSPTSQPQGQQDVKQQQDLQLQQIDHPQAESQQQQQQPQEEQNSMPLQLQLQLELQRAPWEEMASLSSIYSTARNTTVAQPLPSTDSSSSPLSGVPGPIVQSSGSTAAPAANAPDAPSNTTLSATSVPAIQRRTSA